MAEYTEAQRRAKRKYYEKNKELVKAKAEAARLANPEKHRTRMRNYSRKYRIENYEKAKAQRLASGKRLHYKYRGELMDEMGARCVKCGYNQKAALQFDHVYGDGAKDLKSRAPFSLGVHKHMRDSWLAGRIQLLCANCNWVKRAALQEHLTEEKRTVH